MSYSIEKVEEVCEIFVVVEEMGRKIGDFVKEKRWGVFVRF